MLAGGGSVELHNSQILCQSFSVLLGCKIWCSFCSHLGLWNTVHLLCLDWSLPFPGDFTSSFHPQSNGTMERFHRYLKTALRARLAGSEWFLHLPLVVLGLVSVPKEDPGFSISEAVFGSPLTIPGEFLESSWRG